LSSKFHRALGFIHHEATGGIFLLFAAILALIIANSAAFELYDSALHAPIALGAGALTLQKSVLHWINDGLMAIFFLLVGLEIKRELVAGELSTIKQATLPLAAAIGGMAVPALIYVFLNRHDPASLAGWAIPSATDIAFAVGVLAVLGSRIPPALKVFLLALAILDDLGAIIIIAIFYTSDLSVLSLALAAAGLAVLAIMNRMGVSQLSPFLLVGLFVWLCVLKSGVHATLAGVATALSIPLNALKPDGKEWSPLETLMEQLHPWVTFFILPLFAFANAGVSLAGVTMEQALGSVPLGIALGLIVGKPVGIFAASWLAIRSGAADLPEGAGWTHILGAGMLAGIGFTMSLFIGSLAFPDPASAIDVRIGVLFASLVSAVAGYIVLSRLSAKAAHPTAH
jgi:Na+:H+ antiporter, NhaA family